jgi:hypothetical protein
MGDDGVHRQNRRFHWRAIAIGENSVQRDLNDVPEIQFNFVVAQGIEEAVERLLQLGFEFSDDGYDSVNRRFINNPCGL